MTMWLNEIRSMGIFLICAQMLIHFRPKSSYVKYLRLLFSLILLAQFIEPIGRIAGILEKGQIQNMMQKMEWTLADDTGSDLNINEEILWRNLLEDLSISDHEGNSLGEEE